VLVIEAQHVGSSGAHWYPPLACMPMPPGTWQIERALQLASPVGPKKSR
jgi:hypothetical protein